MARKLRVRVDHDVCVGNAMCETIAPKVFRLNDDRQSEAMDPGGDTVEKIIEPNDLIWVHDYHFIPIADALRRRRHANQIGFFLHVPMPPPEVLTSLPNHEQLIPLLLQYDVVGFQTEGDSGNFVFV